MLRKRIRLAPNDYDGNRIYFLTLCCHARSPWFKSATRAAWLVQELREHGRRHGFLVHASCVMPDHVHLLVEGESFDSNLVRFVSSLKQETGYAFKKDTGESLWQRSFFDYTLRNDREVDDIAWYIWMNPVRKRLVADPASHPFSGSFTVAWPPQARPEGDWQPPWRGKAGVAAPFRAPLESRRRPGSPRGIL